MLTDTDVGTTQDTDFSTKPTSIVLARCWNRTDKCV